MAMVYTATHVLNGKVYVGYTSKTLSKRRHQHENSAKNGHQCRKFHAAISKYGPESFEWSVVADGLTKNEALQLERETIARFDAVATGYNLSHGGDCPTWSAESRARAVLSWKSRTPNKEALARSAATVRLPGARERCAAAKRGSLNPAKRPEVRALLSIVTSSRRPEVRLKQSRVHQKLTAAQAANLLMLCALGSTLPQVSEWFGVHQATARRMQSGAYGWGRAVSSFLEAA